MTKDMLPCIDCNKPTRSHKVLDEWGNYLTKGANGSLLKVPYHKISYRCHECFVKNGDAKVIKNDNQVVPEGGTQ